jgi:hypothetical protein
LEILTAKIEIFLIFHTGSWLFVGLALRQVLLTPKVVSVGEFLEHLIIASEYAAQIACVCRSDESFESLQEEKTELKAVGDRVASKDFKTLADVLIQAYLFRYLSKKVLLTFLIALFC